MDDQRRDSGRPEATQESLEASAPELRLRGDRIGRWATGRLQADLRVVQIVVGAGRDHDQPRPSPQQLPQRGVVEVPARGVAAVRPENVQVDERAARVGRDRARQPQGVRRPHEGLRELAGVRVADQHDLAAASGYPPEAARVRSEGRRVAAAAQVVGVEPLHPLPTPHLRAGGEPARSEREPRRGGAGDRDAGRTERQDQLAPHTRVDPDRVLDVPVREPGGKQRDGRGRDSDVRPVRPESAREDDQRPVPEVPAVGEVADPDRRPRAEPARDHAALAGARDEEQRDPDHEQRGLAGREHPGPVEDEQADDEPGHACRGDDVGQAERDPAEEGHAERHERPRAELPGAARRSVEAEPLRVLDAADRIGERIAVGEVERERGGAADRDDRQPAPSELPAEQEQRREDEVELLLDPECPRVQERVEPGADVEVAAAQVVEIEVGREERGGDPGQAGGLLRCDRAAEDAGGRDEHEQHGQGRQKAADAPGVEGAEAEPAGVRELAHERRGDHEAGDDEEDVDAREAARQWQARVVADHEQHGEGPQPLDVGAPVASAAHPIGIGCGVCRYYRGLESGEPSPCRSRAAIPRSVSLPYSWLSSSAVRIATETRSFPRVRSATWWSTRPAPEPQPPLK